MSLCNFEDVWNRSRREVLIALHEAIDTENIDDIVGVSPLLDLSLYAMTIDSTELREKLSAKLNTEELQKDIEHVRNSAALRKKRKEVLECEVSTTKR